MSRSRVCVYVSRWLLEPLSISFPEPALPITRVMRALGCELLSPAVKGRISNLPTEGNHNREPVIEGW